LKAEKLTKVALPYLRDDLLQRLRAPEAGAKKGSEGDPG
jgi:hypothetical protein